MLVSLFCSFSHKKTKSGSRAFHDLCRSQPLALHNGFMFLASRTCFKHFFRFQAQVKCLKHLREAKNMKPLWKVNGFEQHMSWNVRVPDFVLS